MVELIDIFRSVRQFAVQKALQFWRKYLTVLETVDTFIASFGLDPDKLAQVDHFSVSYGLTFTAYVVGWVFGPWYAGIIVGFIIGGPWVYWKEVDRDPKPPENAPFFPTLKTPFVKSGLFDATMYWAGIGTATLLAAAIGMAFPR